MKTRKNEVEQMLCVQIIVYAKISVLPMFNKNCARVPFEVCPSAVWSVPKRTLIFLTFGTFG